jgi:hypothetical protein
MPRFASIVFEIRTGKYFCSVCNFWDHRAEEKRYLLSLLVVFVALAVCDACPPQLLPLSRLRHLQGRWTGGVRIEPFAVLPIAAASALLL